MIDKSEIMEFSRKFKLRPNVIEKDYVLGWVLAGIFNPAGEGSDWIFKGGTCLKKCWYETHRFSEDLDFTLTAAAHLNQEDLVNRFRNISGWVYEASGIEIPKKFIRFDVYQNSRGGMSAEGRIGYRGPLQQRGDLPRLKLDLTMDEILVLNPVVKNVHHPYSDCPDNGIHIRSYCFEEVFAEKIRALAERERPRDLYDVVCLYRHEELRGRREIILNTLEKKCAFKMIPVPTMDSLSNRPEREELEAEWENMLGHQMSDLPDFKTYWAELAQVMDWLHSGQEKNENRKNQ